MRVLIRSPLLTLHTPIVLSQDPDAKYSPFGENAKLQTDSYWPIRYVISSQFYTLHTPIVLSWDPDAKNSPFGDKTTLKIALSWPLSLNREHIDLFSKFDIYNRSFLF